MVRYYGPYANPHPGKVRKAELAPLALRIVEELKKRIKLFEHLWRENRLFL
jgi:hypothetical protein